MNTNTTAPLNILVFDDNVIHRAAAAAQLGKLGHNVTIACTYDQAQAALTVQTDYELVRRNLGNVFGDFNPYRSDDEAKKRQYFEMEKNEKEKATTRPNYDVVLSDLLVPASGQAQGRGNLAGTEMCVGVMIGILAAVKGRAKYAAVFTDSDHHSHPASACFDVFNDGETCPTPFMIEGTKVLFSNCRNWVTYFDPQDLSREMEYEEYSKLDSSKKTRAKNWAALLDYLLQD